LQSSILTADISEGDLKHFTDLLVESLPANLTSGDILLIHNLLETSVSLFRNVNSSEVANEIAHVSNKIVHSFMTHLKQDVVMVLSVLFSNDSQAAWEDVSDVSGCAYRTACFILSHIPGANIVNYTD